METRIQGRRFDDESALSLPRSVALRLDVRHRYIAHARPDFRHPQHTLITLARSRTLTSVVLRHDYCLRLLAWPAASLRFSHACFSRFVSPASASFLVHHVITIPEYKSACTLSSPAIALCRQSSFILCRVGNSRREHGDHVVLRRSSSPSDANDFLIYFLPSKAAISSLFVPLLLPLAAERHERRSLRPKRRPPERLLPRTESNCLRYSLLVAPNYLHIPLD